MNAVVAFDQLVRGESPAKPDDSLQVENPERRAGNPHIHAAALATVPFHQLFQKSSGSARDFCLASLSSGSRRGDFSMGSRR